ncbi:hypothetical protein EYF80_046922 [Liparis tanakae]|uniref:Uncharacterized protein n=1 Tax=Liparis tanakae TaxID=230148 RepID=A0A4Z2FPQ5_9TELE|nr:hypothetical protein EYF80_046922 [Liparis tanakae]
MRTNGGWTLTFSPSGETMFRMSLLQTASCSPTPGSAPVLVPEGGAGLGLGLQLVYGQLDSLQQQTHFGGIRVDVEDFSLMSFCKEPVSRLMLDSLSKAASVTVCCKELMEGCMVANTTRSSGGRGTEYKHRNLDKKERERGEVKWEKRVALRAPPPALNEGVAGRLPYLLLERGQQRGHRVHHEGVITFCCVHEGETTGGDSVTDLGTGFQRRQVERRYVTPPVRLLRQLR